MNKVILLVDTEGNVIDAVKPGRDLDYQISNREDAVYVGNWRLIFDQNQTAYLEILSQQNNYVFPDCTYTCVHCSRCLGCVRKEILSWGMDKYYQFFEENIACGMSPTGWHELDEYEGEVDAE